MIELNILLGFLSGVKNDSRKTQITSSCPFCFKKEHFYINRYTRLWDCKKCGEQGNEKRLLIQLGQDHLIDEEKTVSISLKNLRDVISSEEDSIPDIKKVLLPVGFKRVYENEYLEKRGLTDSEFIKYKIGKTKLSDKLKDYIIFAVEESGLVVGWVARYTGTDSEKRRYENSKGTKFSNILFGFNELTEDTKRVILVEGMFDKMKIDRVFNLDNSPEVKCLCTFGKKFSDAQRSKVKAFKNIREINLCYDYDAIKEMKALGFELKKNWNTTITYTTKKDVDECTHPEVVEIFKRLQTPQEFYLKNMIKL